MPNADTAHSRQLRQETAEKRRQRILNEGGRDLRVLLEAPAKRKLDALQRWHGTPDKPATATDVLNRLLSTAYQQIEQKELPLE